MIRVDGGFVCRQQDAALNPVVEIPRRACIDVVLRSICCRSPPADDSCQIVRAQLIITGLHLRADLIVRLGDYFLESRDARLIVVHCPKRADLSHGFPDQDFSSTASSYHRDPDASSSAGTFANSFAYSLVSRWRREKGSAVCRGSTRTERAYRRAVCHAGKFAVECKIGYRRPCSLARTIHHSLALSDKMKTGDDHRKRGAGRHPSFDLRLGWHPN